VKGTSEARVAAAIRKVPGAYAYKPPDDARNRKPCDYFAWWLPQDSTGEEIAHSIWFEVKQTPNLERVSGDIVRPSQRAGIADAMRLGIPYWVVIWWSSHRLWTAHLMSNPNSARLWTTSFTLESDEATADIDALIAECIKRG
jgi:hypothetical protein